MKLNKIFGSLLLAAAVCGGLSSCSSSDPNDEIIQYPLASCFAMVADLDGGGVSYYQGVNYVTDINITKSTAKINLTGLELPTGVKYPVIAMSGLGVRGDDGWTVVNGANPAVTMTGFGSVPSIRDFDLRIYDRMIGEYYVPGVMITYEVDGRYKVFSSREGQIVFGTSVSTAPDGTAFKNEEASAGMTFDTKTMKVTVELPGSRFAMGMPAQNIVFKDVPFTLGVDGVAKFEKDALTPMIGDTPYPNFPITDLKAVYNFKTGLTMSFTCTLGPMPYKVEMTAKY